MPDWDAYVRDRLPALQVPPEREIEIVRELAQQLEQCYSEAIASGATDPEARQNAEAHFADWNSLARDINDAERRVGPEPANRRPAGPFSGFRKDVLYALRSLRNNPGFASIAIFT